MFLKHEDLPPCEDLTKNFLQAASDGEESEESVSSLQQTQRKTAASKTATTGRRTSDVGHKKAGRSPSTESTASSESSTASSTIRSTGAPFSTEEVKQKYLTRGNSGSTEPDTRSRVSSVSSNKESATHKPFQSRFLNKTPTTPPPPSKEEDEDETETTSEEETESEEESDEPSTKIESREMAKSDIGPLLARSANAREGSDSSRKTSREEPASVKSRYGYQKDESPTSRYTRSRTSYKPTEEEPPKYGYTSRFLNKSKSSAAIPPEDDEHTRYSNKGEDDSKYPSGRSRYMALKDRRQRLARSKSSQQFGDDDDLDEPMSPTSVNPSAYLASRGYNSTTSSGNDLARSRSSHALKSRDNSPDRSTATEKDGAALSSWARYLKNKYGNRSSGKDKESGVTGSSSGSSSAARRLSLGLPLRSSAELASSDDDSKNMAGSPTTPTAATAAAGE